MGKYGKTPRFWWLGIKKQTNKSNGFHNEANVGGVWYHGYVIKDVFIPFGKKEIAGEFGMNNCIIMSNYTEDEFPNTTIYRWYINTKDKVDDFPRYLVLKRCREEWGLMDKIKGREVRGH